HDLRLMRVDRGFWCLPEVDLRAPLHGGMTALLRARLPAQTLHEAVATGRRYGGGAGRGARPNADGRPPAEAAPRALALADELAPKAHPVMHRLKADLHAPVLRALREREPLG